MAHPEERQWRIGPRQVPRSRRTVDGKALSTNETHPLASSTTKPAAPPALDERLVTTTRARSVSNPALVVLQDGDVDPLGALVPCASENKSAWQRAARDDTVTTTTREHPRAPSLTMKHQWKQAADEFVAQGQDETVKRHAHRSQARDEVERARACPLSTKEETGSEQTTTLWQHARARLDELEHGSCVDRIQVRGETAHGRDMAQRHDPSHVKAMETTLRAKWAQKQKVEALRIAIKCVKVLADTDTRPHVYPYMFRRVSDVLDTFGTLVFERIRAQASEDETGHALPEPLGDHFTSADINVQATETCRNWFYKSACIRELLPRIYIEIALLGCYRFLCDHEYPQIVARLVNMIKGLGDPLIAVYARLYLSLTSSELLRASDQTRVVTSSVLDYFYAFHWYRQNKLQHWVRHHAMDEIQYLALHSPAVQWLLQCLAIGATSDVFETLLAHYQAYVANSMVLYHLCASFPATFYASTPSIILDLIHTASSSHLSKHHLYSLVMTQLSAVPTIAGAEPGGKWHFLNQAWSFLTSQTDVTAVIECAAATMKLVLAHFSPHEAHLLLTDVVRHVNAASSQAWTAETYHFLAALIETTVTGARQHAAVFVQIIPSTAFLTLLELLKREASVQVAKKVLRASVEGTTRTFRLAVVGRAAAVAHTLFVLSCRVHDALDALSTEAERSDVSCHLEAFLTRLGDLEDEQRTRTERAYHAQAEALLMLYTDCRRAFYKLQKIQVVLSTLVLRLAMEMHRHRGGRARTRRNLVHSCLAFAHITLPSLEAPRRKLQLLIVAANVALVTNCIPHIDALLKAAIGLVAELDLSDKGIPLDHVVHLIAYVVNVVMYAPSFHANDAFYYVHALEKATLERIVWPSSLDAQVARIQVVLSLLQVYVLWGQPSLPLRGASIDSNHLLYGGDEAFETQVQLRFNAMMTQGIQAIEALNDETEQGLTMAIELMLDLVNLVTPVLTDELDRKKLRACLAFLGKSMTDVHGKLHLLKHTTALTWYFDHTRLYVATLMRERADATTEKRMKATRQALAETLDHLVV
ncbi:hypothetical protein PsorP6_013056 [Peronosclerospora sorghi]|uniref:Uncharacterized protein n=1 Tax=Peronosclerospora sorghi TaxID=230839 RepID=A0ACC0WH60_9STRA|nr:hypothetical protein PsorP6_013056 [Peronosclerospora sorghi]